MKHNYKYKDQNKKNSWIGQLTNNNHHLLGDGWYTLRGTEDRFQTADIGPGG